MSAVVADTHAWLWYLQNLDELSPTARQTLDDATATGDPIYVAAISVVEVIYLVEKRRYPASILDAINQSLTDTNARLAPLDHAVAQAVRQVPRDIVPDLPDRIITATALHLQLPLVTRDARIRAAAVRTIW